MTEVEIIAALAVSTFVALAAFSIAVWPGIKLAFEIDAKTERKYKVYEQDKFSEKDQDQG